MLPFSPMKAIALGAHLTATTTQANRHRHYLQLYPANIYCTIKLILHILNHIDFHLYAHLFLCNYCFHCYCHYSYLLYLLLLLSLFGSLKN
ncbi:hypothetical protein BY458DRAFT_515121, partial [Sporodiniella umbellata]